MILIVVGTGPINYLIQIGHIDLLSTLADKTVLPSVRAELLNDAAPANARAWAANPPGWVEIHAAKQVTGTRDISGTDREALARELNASFLLMDDQQAHRCASALEVITLGTLGLLKAAAARGLVSLPAASQRSIETSEHCFFAQPGHLIPALFSTTPQRSLGLQSPCSARSIG
jgi:predicted nucleic acid-binding protein